MKKILFMIAMIASAASVQASYLYWQLDSDDIANAAKYAGQEVNGVRIFAYDKENGSQKFLNLGYADYSSDAFTKLGYSASVPVGGMLLAQIDASDEATFKNGNYSFYIELINGSENVTYWNNKTTSAYQGQGFVGQMEDAKTYTQLADAGFIGADLSPVSMAVWHGGSQYSAVPEPTSAVLMLIGMAGLALRRRRAV